MGNLVNLARNYKTKCEYLPMKSSSPRKWIAKNLLAAKPKSARIHVEELEGRWVPASAPPGNYSGNIATDTEFDQAGTYTINGNLNVVAGKTLTIGSAASTVRTPRAFWSTPVAVSLRRIVRSAGIRSR